MISEKTKAILRNLCSIAKNVSLLCLTDEDRRQRNTGIGRLALLVLYSRTLLLGGVAIWLIVSSMRIFGALSGTVAFSSVSRMSWIGFAVALIPNKSRMIKNGESFFYLGFEFLKLKHKGAQGLSFNEFARLIDVFRTLYICHSSLENEYSFEDILNKFKDDPPMKNVLLKLGVEGVELLRRREEEESAAIEAGICNKYAHDEKHEREASQTLQMVSS